MTVNVYFDVKPLLENFWTGIPVFTARLALQLLADSDVNIAFGSDLRLIETNAVCAAVKQQTGLYLCADLRRGRNIRFDSPGKFDVALFPSTKDVFSVAPREASVVHDISTLLTPEFHTSANIAHHRCHMRREIQSNELTFAVSHATGEDLQYYLSIPSSAIQVLNQYVAWPEHFGSEYESRFEGRKPPNFIAVLGTIEPRKNLRVVISAFQQLLDADPTLQVVVIGKKGWKLDSALTAEVDRWIAEESLLITGFVSEFQKYCYLRMCKMLVFPSLFEGFGIPVLEALSLGTPVLASWSSSIPEVGRDAVHYFDPLSTADFIAQFKYLWGKVDQNPAPLRDAAFEAASRFTPQAFYEPVARWIHHA
ncbi:Glycosyl transferase, group 1 [Bosea sp. LC85]|uniref:glycosyltransferase family 4 protein n=1 Tax=Bosea sp. LC85 TaxID=1502851 RepID=UPI0004E44EA7|nr:glycosyltransferase family 1 protein [Bosea sp. LC85]KFC64616.1 Glycosyl transferase, group 1 [Bosea sp. LC85]